MTMQTDTTSMPRLIRDVDEARQELTRRRGFEEPDLSPRMQEGIRRVFGDDDGEVLLDREESWHRDVRRNRMPYVT